MATSNSMTSTKDLKPIYGRERVEANGASASLGIERFTVLFIRNGREHRTPWFNSRNRVHQAREIMASKYGQAIVYCD